MGYFFPVFCFSPYVKKYTVERCTKETLGNQSLARSSVVAGDLWPLAKLHFLHKKWFWIISSFISHCCYHSATQSCPILQPHGLKHDRVPCPSTSYGAWVNSCALTQWCHSTLLSTAFNTFSSCLQFFLASSFFLTCRLSVLGGQSIGDAATALVFPKNIQD